MFPVTVAVYDRLVETRVPDALYQPRKVYPVLRFAVNVTDSPYAGLLLLTVTLEKQQVKPLRDAVAVYVFVV